MNKPPLSLFPEGATGDDIGYCNIAAASTPHAKEAKGHIDSLWHRFAPYADSQFPEAIRNHLDVRYWEMYLGCSLLECGLSIESDDEGPDFKIELPDGRLWIEAVSPSPGADINPDAVPPLEFGSRVATQVPTDQIVLRIRSAIRNKLIQRQEFIDRGHVEPSDRYIIAINTRQIRSALGDTQPPYIVRAVYPVGNAVATIHRDSDQVDWGYQHQPSIRRVSGAEVPSDVFVGEEYAGISAVLHSHVDPCNRPDTFGADFKIVHNFRAHSPLPERLLPASKEWVAEEREEELTLRNILEED